jgi:WD40 repeat protein
MEDWQRLYNGWRLSVDDWRRDKTLNALAAWQTPYGAMAAACCDASPIPIWLLEEQRQVAQLDVDITGARDLDFGHEHLVACSGDRLYIWDASRQWSGITVDAGHPVSSVACGMYTGEPCVASGGYDGSVRMWRFDGSQLGIIDIDEKIMSMTVMHGGRFAIGTQRGLAVIEAS